MASKKKAGELDLGQEEWADPGDHGKLMELRLDELELDMSYQRPEHSAANTRSMAATWSWASCNTLTVMRRDSGRYFIVDGGQRSRAAKLRGIEKVPCMVFHSSGRDQEARAFIEINARRHAVPAVYKFNAHVKARLEPQHSINAWLTKCGLVITPDGGKATGIDFPNALVQGWVQDTVAAQRAVLLQREIVAPESSNSFVFKGLWWLEHNGIHVAEHVEKLKVAGGKVGIMQAIKVMKIETGKDSPSVRLCGMAILNLINHKKRKRIPLPNAGDSGLPLVDASGQQQLPGLQG